MSQSWPPQQPWPPRQGRPQPPNPDYPNSDYPDAGYQYPDTGYGPPSYGPPSYGPPDSGYGYQQPSQPRQPQQPGGWPPTDGGARPQGPTSRPLYQQYPQYQQYSQPSSYPQQSQYQPNRQDPWHQQDPQYQQAHYGSPYGYDKPYAPERSRGWLLPVLLVVVLLLVAGGGVYALTRNSAHSGATASSTQVATSATGTPGIPQGFRAYTDDNSHIRVAIPQGWTTTGSPSSADAKAGLVVSNSDETSEFVIKEYNFAASDALTADTAAANGALAGAAGSGGVTNKQGPTNVRFAGETWVKESGDAATNGETIHIVVLVTTHGNGTYLIGFFSLSSSFSSANRQFFQPIQNSFTFTK